MNFFKRKYQASFTRTIAERLVIFNSVIGCAATGSGKSKVMANIAIRAATKPKAPKCVLVITESRKIYSQLEGEFETININAGVTDVHIRVGKIYLAMCQTLQRRPEMIAEFLELGDDCLVICDEAHIGTTKNVLLQLKPRCLIIGFTATPDFAAAKHLPEIYNDCVVACQVDDLIQDGFLCTYRHKARDKADLSILELRNGDFTEESQEKAFGTEGVYDGLIEDLRQVEFKKCMVFTASIKACEATYLRLLENGFRVCRYYSGNKDYKLKNPEYELDKFIKLDMCDICVSVGQLTKGFDFPPIDLVCLMRKTKSLPLYLQMIGRGSRPIYTLDAEGNVLSKIKTSFTVLDYGSHWKTLGFYWDDRDWLNMWKPPKNKKKRAEGEGVMNVKQCINCDDLIPISCRVCPGCGFEYPLIEKELEVGELVEVTSPYSILIGKKTSELSADELAMYCKVKNKRKHADLIAKAQEQRSPGFLRQYAESMGYRKDWIYIQEREVQRFTHSLIEFHDIELR